MQDFGLRGWCFTKLLAADVQLLHVHDITINDHISYIELVHVAVYSQIWRHFLWILTLRKSLEDLILL